MSLADCWPQPRLLTLAGTPRMVAQFQLRDLAILQGWIAEQAPQPERLEESDSLEERHAKLRRNYERAERGAPCFGSPEAQELLGSVGGGALQLWLSLRKGDSTFGMPQAIELAGVMTPEDWIAFGRVAYDVDPADDAEAAIDAEIGVELPAASAEPHAWDGAVVGLCQEMGWTLDEVGSLSLSQWKVIQRGGRPALRGTECPEGWTREDFEERCQGPRRAFWKAGESTEATPDGD